MRFELIEQAKKDFSVQRLCQVVRVSQSGYFAWQSRLPSRRQREDRILLAHVRSAFSLSNGTYGNPRMTRELRDQGLVVGLRRTTRLMRDNGLRTRQKQRFKRTTGSVHAWPIAPNLLAAPGIVTGTIAEMLIVLGDNAERIRSEAAFAKLCGVCPIPASSGNTTRHRLCSAPNLWSGRG